MSNNRISIKLKNSLFSSIIEASKRRRKNKEYTSRNIIILKNFFDKLVTTSIKLSKESMKFFKLMNSFIEEHRIKQSLKQKIYFNDEILMSIIDDKNENSKTLKEIKEKYFMITGNGEFSISTLRRYMINNLKYSFRSIPFINLRSKDDNSRVKDLVYFSKLREIIRQERIILYLDESSFSERRNSVKAWNKRNTNTNISNGGRVRSISIMGAISENALLHWVKIEGRYNSTDFIRFIEELEDKISNSSELKEHLDNRNIFVVLDNAKIHTSKYSRRELKKKRLRFVFQTPYNPQFNPIELLWGMMKRKKSRKIIKNM